MLIFKIGDWKFKITANTCNFVNGGAHTIYVVSCKTKGKAVKQYDYNQALNNFIGEVATIFKTAMFEAFLPYAWIVEDDPLL
ncbi:hypothetical protein [Spiroplasma endosymbiont of Panorpa germanica]|uniref:hypothetical protein n=1 Tax=Spiroplasma endosymbiont of Panorpa germanica TaxID=3066314 RepID=UPI0030CBBE20